MLETTKAYIAGFLDGDGCVMLQLVRRKDYVYGYQIRASVVFYQKADHISYLRWLKHKLRYGYIRQRNDGIAEYTIVGYGEVKKILTLLEPYVRLKRRQVRLTLEIIDRLPPRYPRVRVDLKEFLALCNKVDKFAKLNYSKKRKNTAEVVKTYLLKQGLLSP